MLLLSVIIFKVSAINEKYTISGHIRDNNTGEDLIGATVYVKELNSGTVTNVYGFYSLTLPAGKYSLEYTYIGYQPKVKEISLTENITLNVELLPKSEAIEGVEISAEASDRNIVSNEMSVEKLQMKSVKKIPALMGEVDVIKAIQLLPGVSTTSEGSTGYTVRGGGADQNLVLLDEATVYNSSHLLGFFSVFNNDAVKDIKLYKGDMPPKYGGRLSSILDIRMKEGNMKEYKFTGGIGLLSSRLTVEGPVIKDKTSFVASGRRSYFDLFLPLSKEKEVRKSKLYFYDLNMKINHKFNENNRLYASGYFGRDVFYNEFARMGFGNQTFTLRWNHLFSKKLFSNFTVIKSKYDYELGTAEDQPNSVLWKSNLQDFSGKMDFNYYLNTKNTVKFGGIVTLHDFYPADIRGIGDSTIFDRYVMPNNYALEYAGYLSNEQKLTKSLTLKYGVRWSFFNRLGRDTVYNYDENYDVTDTSIYGKNEPFSPYNGLEPRVGLNYVINKKNAVKASYSRTRQYVHLARNSTAGTPLDIWFPSSEHVNPQVADQVAVGYFRNFRNNTIETSVETYYKDMQHVIDFKDHAILLLNRQLEGELRFGDAWSYGVETMVRIKEGRLNGWVSYTYSRSFRKVKAIQDDPYPAFYDKPHDVSIVLNYELKDNIVLSGNWVYSTGNAVTFPAARAELAGLVVPIYSDRNGYRMPDYHRLDLGLTVKDKPVNPNHELVFSIYNAYNRKNAWIINFVTEDDDPSDVYAEKTYLFPIIPSITYNFYF